MDGYDQEDGMNTSKMTQPDENHQHPAEEACVDCAPPSVPREVFSLLSPPSQLAAATASVSTSIPAAASQSTECQDIQPPEPLKPAVIIEFCDRCRW